MVAALGKLQLKGVVPYFYIIAGAAWVGIIALGGGGLLAWPATVSILAGLALVIRPGLRISKALVKATAVYGLLLCAYQVYLDSGVVSTASVAVAGYSAAVFVVLGVLYAYLFYYSIR
jgi:hypothetical protein